MPLRERLLPLARGLGLLLGSVLVAVGLVALIVRLLGGDPDQALRALHAGSIAYPRSLTETLIRSTPLIFTGLSVAIAFRCGIWNIGAEGQFLVGMLGSTLAALFLPALPPLIGAPVCLLAGGVAGALWAAVAAQLKLRRNVSEVISTIMLNFLAVFLLDYLVRGPLRDPASIDDVSAALPAWARLHRFSRLFGLKEIGGGSLALPGGPPAVALGLDAGYLHAGVALAVAAALALWFWSARSGAGFRLRAVGLNPTAAAAAGIGVERTVWTVFLLSGFLAGLAGGVEQLASVSRLHRYAAGEPGYGFSGIAVALLGGLHAPGVLASALFFGALRAGCDQMQRSAGISYHVAYVIQAALVLLLLSLPRFRLPALGRRRGAPRVADPNGAAEG